MEGVRLAQCGTDERSDDSFSTNEVAEHVRFAHEINYIRVIERL